MCAGQVKDRVYAFEGHPLNSGVSDVPLNDFDGRFVKGIAIDILRLPLTRWRYAIRIAAKTIGKEIDGGMERTSSLRQISCSLFEFRLPRSQLTLNLPACRGSTNLTKRIGREYEECFGFGLTDDCSIRGDPKGGLHRVATIIDSS